MHEPRHMEKRDPVTSVSGIKHGYLHRHGPSMDLFWGGYGGSTWPHCAEQLRHNQATTTLQWLSVSQRVVTSHRSSHTRATSFGYCATFSCMLRLGMRSTLQSSYVATARSRLRPKSVPSAKQHLRMCTTIKTKGSTPHHQALTLFRGDLTLTLFHVDTTWRFDTFDTRRASPKLSWPTIRKFFTPGSFVEGDLILRDQHCHPDALRTLRE